MLANILLVEDEKSIVTLIKYNLEKDIVLKKDLDFLEFHQSS